MQAAARGGGRRSRTNTNLPRARDEAEHFDAHYFWRSNAEHNRGSGRAARVERHVLLLLMQLLLDPSRSQEKDAGVGLVKMLRGEGCGGEGEMGEEERIRGGVCRTCIHTLRGWKETNWYGAKMGKTHEGARQLRQYEKQGTLFTPVNGDNNRATMLRACAGSVRKLAFTDRSSRDTERSV